MVEIIRYKSPIEGTHRQLGYLVDVFAIGVFVNYGYLIAISLPVYSIIRKRVADVATSKPYRRVTHVYRRRRVIIDVPTLEEILEYSLQFLTTLLKTSLAHYKHPLPSV